MCVREHVCVCMYVRENVCVCERERGIAGRTAAQLTVIAFYGNTDSSTSADAAI